MSAGSHVTREGYVRRRTFVAPWTCSFPSRPRSLSLRLAAELVAPLRATPRRPSSLAWAASLGAFAAASAALAWGAAAGWDDRSFRVYYLFGGLLTAALLGARLAPTRRASAWPGPRRSSTPGSPSASRVAVPIDPARHRQLDPRRVGTPRLLPCARCSRSSATSAGTLAAVGVALDGLRRRPVGNGADHRRGRRRGRRQRPRRARRGRRRRSSPPSPPCSSTAGFVSRR